MQIKYKFIHFEKVEDGVKTRPFYQCKNNKSGDNLGFVEYDRRWKLHTFNPSPHTVFSVSCMQDIIHFIGQL